MPVEEYPKETTGHSRMNCGCRFLENLQKEMDELRNQL
jgi:hypothetical protein